MGLARPHLRALVVVITALGLGAILGAATGEDGDARALVPIAPWVGHLELPDEPARRADGGVWLRVRHAPDDARALVGQRVWLAYDPEVARLRARMARATVDVMFTAEIEENARAGSVYPRGVDGWRAVSALESRAAARPGDPLLVAIDRVRLARGHSPSTTTLFVERDPVEVAGTHVALVRFTASGDVARGRVAVQHYDAAARAFTGARETVVFRPTVARAQGGGLQTSLVEIERTPENARGYRAYGLIEDGAFVLTAVEPHEALLVEPSVVRRGAQAGARFFDDESWANLASEPHGLWRVAIASPPEPRLPAWTVGERALFVHVFGTTGGKAGEPFPWRTLSAGHFSLGVATVVRDPFTGEPRFDLVYHQLYGGNPDGIVAGRQSWSSYMGSLARGWMYRRPVSDTILRHPTLSAPFPLGGVTFDPLAALEGELEVMAARWRSGDGEGGVVIDAASNCVQDAMQAVFVALRRFEREILEHPVFARSAPDDPARARVLALSAFLRRLEQRALPLGGLRRDWQKSAGLAVVEDRRARGLRAAARAALTAQTMMPRAAHDLLAQVALDEGAELHVVRTNLLGGAIADIAPLPPKSIFRRD